MRRKHMALLALLAGTLPGLFVSPARASDQVWLKNSISLNRGTSTGITFTHESRFRTFTVFDDHYLSAYYLEGTYNISPAYYSAIGIRRQDTDLATYTSHENRVYVQGGRKQRLAKRLALDSRTMIEYRSFEQPTLDDYFRFRVRLKLAFEGLLKGVKFKPFISEELFADDRAGSREFLKRNRVFAGLTVPLGKHAGCEASYMVENDRGVKSLRALVAGIQIKL